MVISMYISAINKSNNYNYYFQKGHATNFGKNSRENTPPSLPVQYPEKQAFSELTDILNGIISVNSVPLNSKYAFLNANAYTLSDNNKPQFIYYYAGDNNQVAIVKKYGETLHHTIYQTQQDDILKVNKISDKLEASIEKTPNETGNSFLYKLYDENGKKVDEFNIPELDISDKHYVMNILANTNTVFDFFEDIGVSKHENLQNALTYNFFDSICRMAQTGETNANIIRSYNTYANKYHASREHQFSQYIEGLKNTYWKDLEENKCYIPSAIRINAFNSLFTQEGKINLAGFETSDGSKEIIPNNQIKYNNTNFWKLNVRGGIIRTDLLQRLNSYFNNDPNHSNARKCLKAFGITPIIRKNLIVGFEGILNTKLHNDDEHSDLKEILDDFYKSEICISNTTFEKNQTAKGIFNAFPELHSIVGKKQMYHENSVDKEIFDSIEYLSNNDYFKTLDSSIKKVLVITAILQDISGEESGKNYNHGKISHTIARNILENLEKNGANLTSDEINLISKLIYNHEWFETSLGKNSRLSPIKANAILSYLISKDSNLTINDKKLSAQEISAILNLLTQTNIAVSRKDNGKKFENYIQDYNQNFKTEYTKYKYSTLRQDSPKYDFGDNSSMFEKQIVNGEEIYVVKDFNKNICAHMTQDLKTMLSLYKSDYSDIQSVSLLASEGNETVWNLNYGFLISFDKEDVVAESSKDLDSGYNKNIYTAVINAYPQKLLATMQSALKNDIKLKDNMPQVQTFAKELGIHSKEQYERLSTEDKTIFMGKLLEKANCAQDSAYKALINEIDERGRTLSEILVNNPKLSALLIKGSPQGIEKDIEQLPEVIKFAKENDLKIVYYPKK